MQLMIFIVDLIACSTCLGHHYSHHQELESIIQMDAACCRYGVELRVVCMVCGLQPANHTHNSCIILSSS